jgi:hypothetical protein
MPQILNILLTTIAPIIIIAGLGALLDRTQVIDTQPLSRVVIYLGSPALGFYSIANSSMSNEEFGRLILFALSVMVAITAVAWLISAVASMDRLTGSAFVLSASVLNGVNYGIPLNEFAFGQAGLERAVFLGVIFALYTYTMGVFLASSGQASLGSALKNALLVPLPYAAILGLVVNVGQIPVPDMVLQITRILGGMAVPLMLLILGIQLSRTSLHGRWKVMLGASFTRLLGGAALGFLLAFLFSLEGVTRQTAIVEASMPTAVVAGVLATEFKSDAELVSSIVVLSTLLSLLTLPFIILLVR